MKAIETVYKGYRFRSRLEARWAVFFDALGVRYEYEKEGFDLGDAGYYLPDFWLPDLSLWLEVKGSEPTPEEIKKAEALKYAAWTEEAPGQWGIDVEWAVALGVGEPEFGDDIRVFCFDSTDSSGGDQWWDKCQWCVTPEGNIAIMTQNSRTDRDYSPRSIVSLHDLYGGQPLTVRKAAIAARSARFEHGETPRVFA